MLKQKVLKQLLKQMYQTDDLTRPGQRPGEFYVYCNMSKRGPGNAGAAEPVTHGFIAELLETFKGSLEGFPLEGFKPSRS